MSSSTAFDNHGHGLVGGSSRQSRRDAASRELDLLIRDLADARLDFGDNVERIEEEITEETVTTTTTTKRKKKKRRAVSSSRAQEHQRKRERAHQQQLEYHAQPPRRTHTPEVIMVEQPLKLESSVPRKKKDQSKLSKEQLGKKHHHKSDSGVNGGGFTFVTSIEKEFPARYEWMDCLVQTAEDDGHDLHSGRKSKFERRDSNQSNSSGSSSSSSAATASTTNRNNSRQQHVDHHAHASSAAATTKHQQSKQSKSTKNSGSIVAPPSDFNDANAVRSSAGPTTVVNREFDENGGVTKTVTTTTTEEREYKVINYDNGSDLDEAIATDMAELDDLRRLAASAAIEKPKKGHGQRVVTFHDDLRLALSEERDRRHAAVRSLNATQKTRHGSGDSRTSGTVHVPVNSEVRQPPGGGSSKAEDAAYRLRFLWRQPQVKSPSPRHVCFGCNSAIEGRCVTALFKKFHPEHFVCSYCLAQLSQGTFKERGQKPYCQNCYNRL